MTYISWATAYEGATDRAYYEVLLPRILTDISLREGTRSVQIPESAAVQLSLSGRAVEEVAGEICKNPKLFTLPSSTLISADEVFGKAWHSVLKVIATGLMSYAHGLRNAA